VLSDCYGNSFPPIAGDLIDTEHERKIPEEVGVVLYYKSIISSIKNSSIKCVINPNSEFNRSVNSASWCCHLSILGVVEIHSQ